jgi:aldehyde dehydrogenase (NAD+)
MKELAFANYINGERTRHPEGATFSTKNPADQREVVAVYPRMGQAEAELAIDAAHAAFPEWAATSAPARGRYLGAISQLIDANKAELASLLTREEGKTLAESQAEVGRTADIFRFFSGLSYASGGSTIPHDLPKVLLYTERHPLGPVGLITPWNFPIAIPAWKIAPALTAGNTVVMKPSDVAPAMALKIAEFAHQAGLPRGVLNVITGPGSAVGKAITSSPKIKAVSFTGSYSVGTGIYLETAKRMARTQLEMGGKNPTIVLADADLDLAANLVIKAAFGLTGQACTATSRVIVEKQVADALLAKLLDKLAKLKVGNGLVAGVDMGPVVSPSQLETDLGYIDVAKKEGASLVFGGSRITADEMQHGLFLEPTVFDGVTPSMRIAAEEVFGPVLAVMRVGGFDEALALANSLPVGLSATLCTRDLTKALRYTRLIEAGVVKVNQISTGLALQAPFGGVKQSSTDSFKEQGPVALDFYSRTKTVYLDYSS